jgi:hypothetical protein
VEQQRPVLNCSLIPSMHRPNFSPAWKLKRQKLRSVSPKWKFFWWTNQFWWLNHFNQPF